MEKKYASSESDSSWLSHSSNFSSESENSVAETEEAAAAAAVDNGSDVESLSDFRLHRSEMQ